MAQREYFIDRLRVVMTVLVLLMHMAMTYGAAGSWFYREAWRSRSVFSVLGSFYCLTMQAFLLGMFFLLAGYFTPASYDRKGLKRFLLDRCLRLGIPLLAFGLLLAPITVGLAGIAAGEPFWRTAAGVWRRGEFINGPMWFAQALLMFSAGYCAWRWWMDRSAAEESKTREGRAGRVPSSWVWLAGALAVGVTAYLLRIWFPVDKRYIGLWIGFFPSYLFLFVVGILAWRRGWLGQLTRKQALTWLVVSIVAWPVLPMVYIHLRQHQLPAEITGGTSLPAALYAFWEPAVAWGVIAAGIVWFRNSFNRLPGFQEWLSRRAYAVYVIHPPVLVGICVLARSWHASLPIKFVCISPVCCVASWLAADPLVRLPGLRRIF